MSSDDDYRADAAHAQMMADSAISDADKASWLRVAQGWLGWIRLSEPTVKIRGDQQKFDNQVIKDGTKQDDSESSYWELSLERDLPDATELLSHLADLETRHGPNRPLEVAAALAKLLRQMGFRDKPLEN